VLSILEMEPPTLPYEFGALGRRFRLEYGLAVDDEDVRTESQREWANWSAHGYRKLYQPRSILWLGGIFCALLIALLLLVFTGHLHQ